jgi:hypothetical protein
MWDQRKICQVQHPETEQHVLPFRPASGHYGGNNHHERGEPDYFGGANSGSEGDGEGHEPWDLMAVQPERPTPQHQFEAFTKPKISVASTGRRRAAPTYATIGMTV